jgi:hypothetical protein
MANFDKFANLSSKGWDKIKLTQTLKVGENAHIGLKGAGSKGEALDVFSGDERICVPHEEPRPKMPQYKEWRHFLLTGLKEGVTNLKAFLPGTSIEQAAMKIVVTAASSSKVKLVYFPGERDDSGTVLGTIYVIGGKGESIPAAGGPRASYKLASDYGHTADPTPAGHYKLGPRQHVIAPSWWHSALPWGAKLSINAKGEVEYKDDSGKGGVVVVTGPSGVLTKAYYSYKTKLKEKITPKQAEKEIRDWLIDPKSGNLTMTEWELNDFGRWGWNLRLNGRHTPYYLHTTTANEASFKKDKDAWIELSNSHGCIHITPPDRDMFWDKHYLDEGTDFEVRPYTESGPP